MLTEMTWLGASLGLQHESTCLKTHCAITPSQQVPTNLSRPGLMITVIGPLRGKTCTRPKIATNKSAKRKSQRRQHDHQHIPGTAAPSLTVGCSASSLEPSRGQRDLPQLKWASVPTSVEKGSCCGVACAASDGALSSGRVAATRNCQTAETQL